LGSVIVPGMTPKKGAYDMAKLLIADDLVPIRQMVRITLSTQGWTILEAENGQTAIEMARSEHPDLMLLDVDMGAGPNGFDVCRELKSDDDTKGIPIVMLTAHDSESDRAVGFAAGAAQYLTKPFGPLELIDTIRTILAPAQ
jgi:two-component system alkaline phosphatase synthesis response regulator PhoP